MLTFENKIELSGIHRLSAKQVLKLKKKCIGWEKGQGQLYTWEKGEKNNLDVVALAQKLHEAQSGDGKVARGFHVISDNPIFIAAEATSCFGCS